jgi:adenylate cyclase
VDYVARERLCFYEDLDKLGPSTASLAGVEAAVAAPIFGINGETIGTLYGTRVTSGLMAKGVIGRLEAQCVQLLAGAVGANLSRELAIKTRVQFEQFFSTDLARELEHNPNLLEGRTAEITILFSDLRGFTPLAQRLSAATICRMMRDVMERLTHWIIEFGGVIVDFAGDGILAMWNAPAPQADHAQRACRAALAMLNELPALNKRWATDLLPGERLSLGIGVNTGEAQVGNTGSSRRLKYGPQGHAVNLASRVQSAADKLRLPLLVTSSTQAMLPAAAQTRRVGKVRLAGIAEPEVLYELHPEQAAPEWLARRDAYEAALAHFEAQQWLQAFHQLLPIVDASDDPSRCDGPTAALMRRTWECLEARPQPFDAIVEVVGK